MNCLDFRREKLADPRRLSAEALAHLNDCAACRGFAAEINENEARLAAALDVPAPEGLAERVILRSKTQTRLSPRLWAMAANLLIGAVLAMCVSGERAAARPSGAIE